VLAAVLDTLCRLLHPIIPFVTEQVWQALNTLAPERGLFRLERASESVCIAPWPRSMGWRDEVARKTVGLWCEVITALRNLKAESNVPKEARIAPILVARGAAAQSLGQGEAFLKGLLLADSVMIVPEVSRPADCAVAVLPEVEIILPLEGLIDHEAERSKQRKALADFERQIGSLEAKLRNEAYVARAPAEVVAQTRAKLAELESQRTAVRNLLQEA
jgi:valyl-tRNA synthetase